MNSGIGDWSASTLDATQLRVKLERLATGYRGGSRPQSRQRPLYRHVGESECELSRSPSKLSSLSKFSKGAATPLSVHSVSVPPYPTTPQMPSPSQLPWLQLSGTQLSMPSARALRACAGEASERPISTRTQESHSVSTFTASAGLGLPPLPGSVGDGIGMPHTLRDLTKSSRIWSHHDVNTKLPDSCSPNLSCDADDPDEIIAVFLQRVVANRAGDASVSSMQAALDTENLSLGQSDVQPQELAKDSVRKGRQCWLSSCDRKGKCRHRILSESLRWKSSCLKRMFLRLWRSRRSDYQ